MLCCRTFRCITRTEPCILSLQILFLQLWLDRLYKAELQGSRALAEAPAVTMTNKAKGAKSRPKIFLVPDHNNSIAANCQKQDDTVSGVVQSSKALRLSTYLPTFAAQQEEEARNVTHRNNGVSEAFSEWMIRTNEFGDETDTKLLHLSQPKRTAGYRSFQSLEVIDGMKAPRRRKKMR